MSITDQGLVYDLPEAKYHADPVEGGSLSSTGAKRLLEAPAVYRWKLDNPEPPKDAFDFGTAVHSLVLGTGKPPEPHGFDSLRTNKAKEHVALIRLDGKLPVSQQVYDEIRACADAVMDHPVAGPMFARDDSYSEVTGVAQYEGHWLRSRMDLLIPSAHIIPDLKTSAGKVDSDGFAKSVVDFDYHLSAYHYRKVYQLIHGVWPAFVHVVVSKTAPYLVAVHQLDDEFLEIAESRWHRAFARYKHGQETGEWPGIPPVVHSISPPAYAVFREQDAAEQEKAA